jgi:hypothetical protein
LSSGVGMKATDGLNGDNDGPQARAHHFTIPQIPEKCRGAELWETVMSLMCDGARKHATELV